MHLFSFGDRCIWAFWGSVLPAAVVFIICLFRLPAPKFTHNFFRRLGAPFETYLTPLEAEGLDTNSNIVEDADGLTQCRWRPLVFSSVGLVETLTWLTYGSFLLISGPTDAWQPYQPLLIAVSWLYTVVRPIRRPPATPPFDLFVIYCLHFITGTVQIGSIIFDNLVSGTPLPSIFGIVASIMNLATVLGLLAVLVTMPLAVPGNKVRKEEIGRSVSPEDYTTLLGWITFSWVYALIRRGRVVTLNVEDVWDLSPTMQSRPVFIKFSTIPRSSLIGRLWAANSLDFILDTTFALGNVIFTYGGPFFLKKILDVIDGKSSTLESRSNAYIYAVLAFVCSLLKAQVDLQHLWFGRRAAARIRSELMAAIYEKALKRKDLSGIVVVEKRNNNVARNGMAGYGMGSPKNADDPKAGADVGKIVNLMANDANKVSQMVSGAFFLFGAPFEVLLAGTFLFQLLGWSTLAGFFVLVASWPINNYVAKRTSRIQKGVMAARDTRMGVLNELIAAVKFIKLFAWEERWIQRTLDAREHEMKWMVKGYVNAVMFNAIWTCAPVLVSIVSFFVYVMQGNELTVGIAFTSIALFNMIRIPLNVIPTWIVDVLQTGVSLNRIEAFLAEDDVADQVSSLSNNFMDPPPPGSEEFKGRLGIVNASFTWNLAKPKENEDQYLDNPQSSAPGSPSPGNVVTTESEIDISIDSSLLTDSTDHPFELRDISVIFPEGKLSVITGPTASGKTALLRALLGEMTLLPGGRVIMSKNPCSVDEHGLMHSISYAAQSPWLQHQSIKENILFGYPYDADRYNNVVECCALKPDLEALEDGDATEIGDRGVSLSGGQKSRVALARAIYARTKHVLLDDPFSAIDSYTSRFMYERLFLGPLLANRTVILVTHHIELVLPGASYLVHMLDGQIDFQGMVSDLRAQGILDDIVIRGAGTESFKAEPVTTETHKEEDATKKATDAQEPRKLVEDERRELGSVKWLIYKSYIKSSSYWIWGFLTVLVVVNQVLSVSEKLWIKVWGDAYGVEGSAQPLSTYTSGSFVMSGHEMGQSYEYLSFTQRSIPSFSHSMGISWPDAMKHPLFYIGIYALIGLFNVLVGIFAAIAQYTGGYRASRVLFRQLLMTVVRATFRFHDTTPHGRILNRFGKDIETIDSSLAKSLQSVNSSLAAFFASIITIAVVFPWFLLPAFFIMLTYRELAIGYVNTGRDLRRMESNTRSPIFSDFGELLEGIVTVRAFSVERRFLNNLHRKIDTTTKMWYAFWMTNRWLLLRFEALSALSVLVTSLFSILILREDAGLAAVCITSAMSFTTSVYWACRFWTALELDLNSIERVSEYLNLPQEPPAVIDSNRVPAYWPSNAPNNSLIIVENLVVRYAPDLPAVLHGVSFSLRAGERVGLLGRTGSGKSTLAMSILRFMDPASGRILIDGIDISTIGLHDLRSHLSFIPQDATLFSGTLRDNLDPFGEYEDGDCLDALYRVQLISASPTPSRSTLHEFSITTSSGSSRTPSVLGMRLHTAGSASNLTVHDQKPTISLDTPVSAGGANFSQGQKQLIAMARALLRRSSIIVLDEATSSIDFATDVKIQATIREEFTNSLLLTVAHRLHTVIDYDRLIVLERGQIAEMDTPWNLICKEDGIFRNMCLNSGSFGELEAIARLKTGNN